MKERPTFAFNPDTPESDSLYTTARIAELFGVTSETVRAWLVQGKLVGTRLETGQYRVRRADLLAFANRQFGNENENSKRFGESAVS